MERDAELKATLCMNAVVTIVFNNIHDKVRDVVIDQG